MHYYYPNEDSAHLRTWMSFCVNHGAWQDEAVSRQIQKNIAGLVLTIAHFEPVNVLVRKNERDIARHLMGSDVNYIIADLDDIWLRDSGAVFVRDDNNNKTAIDFNFNGWGNKQQHPKDRQAARIMAEHAQVPLVKADIRLEGGGLEVSADGTAILNESCIINPNRNPDWDKARCEASLQRYLGIKNIFWLPGMKDADITDSHIDFYVKFVTPQEILIHRVSNPKVPDHQITTETHEKLKALYPLDEAHILHGPEKINVSNDDFEEFAASYINYYVCNAGVVLPAFGDSRRDGEAREKVQQFYPDREIVQMNIDAIAIGGGGIHCLTQQEYRQER